MQPGDLVRHSWSLGITTRKLQYETDGDSMLNWDGEPAWWVQYVDDESPTWAYEEELTLVGKRN
jgi:hypothetical protein